MTISRLSDEETEELLHLAASSQPVGVIKYVNRLLYSKGLGDDRCARPLAFRNRQELESPCFAVGYLDKVSSFMAETAARDPAQAVKKTQEFIAGLKTEITKFFEPHKEEPCQRT